MKNITIITETEPAKISEMARKGKFNLRFKRCVVISWNDAFQSHPEISHLLQSIQPCEPKQLYCNSLMAERMKTGIEFVRRFQMYLTFHNFVSIFLNFLITKLYQNNSQLRACSINQDRASSQSWMMIWLSITKLSRFELTINWLIVKDQLRSSKY